jgi:hypothetical protein
MTGKDHSCFKGADLVKMSSLYIIVEGRIGNFTAQRQCLGAMAAEFSGFGHYFIRRFSYLGNPKIHKLVFRSVHLATSLPPCMPRYRYKPVVSWILSRRGACNN